MKASASANSRDGTGRDAPAASRNAGFLLGLAQAFGGALLFSLPILLTMEMWWLGFMMDRWRLALMLALTVPLTVALSAVSGFEDTFRFVDDVVDAFAALAVGFVTSALLLILFGAIGAGMALNEVIGKVGVQAVPASIGALLTQSQFSQSRQKKEKERDARREEHEGRSGRAAYARELLVMAVGALFLGLPVAATQEMVLVAYRIAHTQMLALVLLSLAIMHAFVYVVKFRGEESVPSGTPFWSVFLRFTVVGYAVALLVSAYVLWSFGRLDAPVSPANITAILVLGLPGAVGAAAARLIL